MHQGADFRFVAQINQVVRAAEQLVQVRR